MKIKFSELGNARLVDLFTCEEIDEIVDLLQNEIDQVTWRDKTSDKSVTKAMGARKNSINCLVSDLKFIRVHLMKKMVKIGLRNERLIIDE